MREIIVKTQKQFDELSNNFKEYTVVNIISKERIIVLKNINNSKIVFRENSRGVFRENSSGVFRENSRGEFRENSSGEFWENSSGEFWGNSSGEFWENSSGEFWENSSGVFRGRSTAQIFSADSLIMLFAFSVAIISKKIKNHKIKKKSKNAYIQFVREMGWFENNGIKKTQNLILFKRVSHDYKTQEGTGNETLWKIGSIVTQKNWNPKENECGAGKFHAVSRPYFADEFRDKKDDKYIAIKIFLKDVYEWKDDPNYPHKIGFRKGKVLYECDKYGKELPEVSHDKSNKE